MGPGLHLPCRRAVPPASLAVLEGVPGVDYQDETVSFVADDFQQAYDGLIALVGVATTNFPSPLLDGLRSTAQGRETLGRYSNLLFGRWVDVESGRWTPPEARLPASGSRTTEHASASGLHAPHPGRLPDLREANSQACRRLSRPDQASRSWTTRPCTSVRRKSRPWNR